jgi:hypothetical protein
MIRNDTPSLRSLLSDSSPSALAQKVIAKHKIETSPVVRVDGKGWNHPIESLPSLPMRAAWMRFGSTQ